MQKKNAKKRGLFQEAKVSGAGARTGEAPDAIESQGTVNLTIYGTSTVMQISRLPALRVTGCFSGRDSQDFIAASCMLASTSTQDPL